MEEYTLLVEVEKEHIVSRLYSGQNGHKIITHLKPSDDKEHVILEDLNIEGTHEFKDLDYTVRYYADRWQEHIQKWVDEKEHY